MYNEAKEAYVYAIAGGETLQIIDYLERRAAQAEKDLISYTDSFGITAIPTAHAGYVEFKLKDPNAALPEGWTIRTNRAGEHLKPDNSKAGVDVESTLGKFTSQMDKQAQFNDLCHSLAPSAHLNNRKYSYEKIGDDILLTCPKQYEGDAIIPTGSKPISWLEYTLLQEKANPTPTPQTRVFKKKFSPNR